MRKKIRIITIGLICAILVGYVFGAPPIGEGKSGEGKLPPTTTTQKIVSTTTTTSPPAPTTTTKAVVSTTTITVIPPAGKKGEIEIPEPPPTTPAAAITTTTTTKAPTPTVTTESKHTGKIDDDEKYIEIENHLRKPIYELKRLEEEQKKLITIEKPEQLKEEIKLDIDKEDKLSLCNFKLHTFIKGYKSIGDIETPQITEIINDCSPYYVSDKPYVELETDIEKCDLGDFKLKLKAFEIEHLYKRIKLCKEHIALKLAEECDLNSFLKEERDSNGKVKRTLDVDGLEAKCGKLVSKELFDFEDCGLGPLKAKYQDIDFEALYEKVRGCEDKDTKEDWRECDIEYFLKRTAEFVKATGIHPRDGVLFDPADIDIAVKRCAKKLERRLWKWEDCDYRKFIRFHMNNYKLTKDRKVVIHIKSLMKKCNAHIHKKLEKFKNCNIDDIVAKYPKIDVEHIHKRIKLCKKHFEFIKLKEFGEAANMIKVFYGRKNTPIGTRVKWEDDLYDKKIATIEDPALKIDDLKVKIDGNIKAKVQFTLKTIWDLDDCGLGHFKIKYKDIDLDKLYERLENCEKEYEEKKIEECKVEEEVDNTTSSSTSEETFTDVNQCKEHYHKKIWTTCDMGWHLGQKKEELIELYDKSELCKIAVARKLISDCNIVKRAPKKLGGGKGGGGCRISKKDGGACDPSNPNFEGFDYEVSDTEIIASIDNDTLLDLAAVKLPSCEKYKKFNFNDLPECRFIAVNLANKIDDFENIFVRGRNCKLRVKESYKNCETKIKLSIQQKLVERKDVEREKEEMENKNKLRVKYEWKYKGKDWARIGEKLKKCKKELKVKYDEKCNFKPIKEVSKKIAIRGGRGGCHITNNGGPCDPNSPNFEGFDFEPNIEIDTQKTAVSATDITNITNNCKEDFKIKLKEKGYCSDVSVNDIETEDVEKITEEIEECKEKDDPVKKISDCDFTDLELKYPDLDIEETYTKIKHCKEHIATQLWEKCPLENNILKMKKLLRLKIPLIRDDEPIHKKVKFHLKAINIPLRKCMHYKKLTEWKECKLDELKKENPEIDDNDLEEIYERVSDCKGPEIF